jgi:predicted ester cyclase
MTNRDIVKSWFAAIDAKDFNKVKSFIDLDKHKFRNPMTPAPVDAEEHIGMMQMMTSAFEGKHTLNVIFGDEEHIAVSGKWAGKHTGEFNGISATGKPVEFYFVDIFNIVNGKVTNEHFEMNPAAIMVQIGAVPPNA